MDDADSAEPEASGSGSFDFTSLAAFDGESAIAAVATQLRDAGRVDDLFDLRMLAAKLKRGLNTDRPASLSDVPGEQRRELELDYRAAAREAGQALLARGDLLAAWSYFQAINERGPIREALETVPVVEEYDERQQELAQLALYEGVHPRKGAELLLAMAGMCNTVTAVDQVLPSLAADDRAAVAELLVDALHEQLHGSVRRDVQERHPMHRSEGSLPELLEQHPQLLADGAYHTDVSHLGAVVRFARSLEAASPSLDRAIELCDYGARLDQNLQYGGEPPFEDSYVAHRHLFEAVRGSSNEQRQLGLEYFRKKLADEPDAADKPLLAYVLTDLLMRCDRPDEAVAVAREHLADLGDQTGFSFAELCRLANRADVLADWAAERNDPVNYLIARFAATSDESSSGGPSAR